LRPFDDNTAIARLDWWQPFKPGEVSSGGVVAAPAGSATSLEDWVWRTLDGIAGAAGVKALEDEEKEEPSPVDDSEHLVSMVASITFSSS